MRHDISSVSVLLITVFSASGTYLLLNRCLVKEWVCSICKLYCYSFNTGFQGTLTLPNLIILCTFAVFILGHLYICPIYQSWRMLAKGHFCVRFARLCPVPSPQRERNGCWDPKSLWHSRVSQCWRARPCTECIEKRHVSRELSNLLGEFSFLVGGKLSLGKGGRR